jgi:hypothetical protein
MCDVDHMAPGDFFGEQFYIMLRMKVLKGLSQKVQSNLVLDRSLP